MKWWVIYVQHSSRVVNEISRISFDDEETAKKVSKELKGLLFFGDVKQVFKAEIKGETK